MDPRLQALAAANRAAFYELRKNINKRRALAQSFRAEVGRAAGHPVRLPDHRIAAMTTLVLKACNIAITEQNGQTIDILTDALSHLQDRLEKEVIPHLREP